MDLRNISLRSVFVVILLGTMVSFTQTVTAAECTNTLSSEDTKTGFVIRWGLGGFRDSRSPDGDVGGGQLALDMIPCDFPVSLTLSSEYYTRSADPTDNFEISSLYALNLVYGSPLPAFDNTDYFISAGIGRLKVPDAGAKIDDNLFNLEAGFHWKRFQRVGFYGSLKYLHAEKSEGGRKPIDFNEVIFLLGVTYRFAL